MSCKNRRNLHTEKDISLLIRQISEPTFQQLTTKQQRSFSFLANKQLKCEDSASFSSSSFTNGHASPSPNIKNSYFFSRQNSTNGSFIRRSFIRQKSSHLTLLIQLVFAFITNV